MYIEKYKNFKPDKSNERNAQRRDTRIKFLIQRDGPFCVYCYILLVDDKKCNDNTLTFDHVHPRDNGGPNGLWNLALCCWRCNNIKGNQTLEEFLNNKKFLAKKHRVMTQIQREARRENQYFDLFKGKVKE